MTSNEAIPQIYDESPNDPAQRAPSGSTPWVGRLLGKTYIAIDCHDGDSMTWPAATREIAELEWTLRYAKDGLTQTQCYILASLVAAYVQMVNDPIEKRNRVCKAIRSAQSAKKTPSFQNRHPAL